MMGIDLKLKYINRFLIRTRTW